MRECTFCNTSIEAFDDETARKDHIKHFHRITNNEILADDKSDGPFLVYELLIFGEKK